MTSLADVYEGHVGEVQNVRRLYLGTGLFLAGAVLAVLGMLVGTTGLPGLVGVENRYTAFKIAGVLAGLGAPAVFVGVSTVLPGELRLRAAAVIGASVTVLGVALFWYAYPYHWAGYGMDLTPYVLAVYFLGVMTTLGCVFVGIANFKQRNDPGGTVSLRVETDDGETRVVEVDRERVENGSVGDLGGAGGVGMLGGTPDGDVETQTNRRTGAGSSSGRRHGGSTTGGTSRGTSGRDRGSSAFGASGTGTASDGGAAASDISSPLDDVGPQPHAQSGTNSRSSGDLADRYCGNCRHFKYVQSNAGMRPYCARHDTVMDDMEACDEWAPNNE